MRSASGRCARCSSCKQAATVDRAVIEHPPGAETLWDWVELPDPPTRWGWISTAYVLMGALPHSGRWRGWLAESTDQPHLVEGLDAVTRRLGGLSRRCGTTGEAPGASAGSDPRPASQPAS